MIMEWSKENIMNLIETYHAKTIIWDPQDPDHFNKIKKQDAWMEIANEVGRPVDQCKKKIENLLASLGREKMKMKKSTGTGKGTQEVYKSNWFAFNSLQFILDKNKTKPSLNTMHLLEDEEAYPQKETGSSVEDEASAKAPASQDKEASSIAEIPQIKRTIQTPGKNRKKAKSTASSDSERLEIKPSNFSNPQPIRSIPIKMNVSTLMANQGRYNITYPRLPHIPQTVVNPTILSENYSNNPGSFHLSYNTQNTSIHNSRNFTPTVPLPSTSTSSEMSHSSQNTHAYDSENLSPSPIPTQLLSPNNSTYSDDFTIQDLI